jgi:tartrate-resistant acid phosphatase type 5
MRVAAVVAAACLAGAPGCSRCGSPTFTVRAPRAAHPAPAPPLAGPVVRVLHLADFGEQNRQQAAVAGAVAAAHRAAPFDLAFFSGDNLYECGPRPDAPGAAACRFDDDANRVAPGFVPPQDRTFGEHERALAFLAGAVPVHLSLGNHDVAASGSCGGALEPTRLSRLKACLEVAHASPVWSMPARHYTVDRGAARFLVVDSNLALGDYGGFRLEDEIVFVRDAAQGCRADACEAEPGGCARPWCFLVGHHPPVTAGKRRKDATPAYLARMQRILDAGGGRVRAWLGGHDHDLQHLRTRGGLDVFVSGNGSRGRPSERFEHPTDGAERVFASVRWGFGVLEVAPGGWRYRFVGVDGVPAYCCAAQGAGRCEPVSCP